MQKVKTIGVLLVIFFSVSGFADDNNYGRSYLVSDENSLSSARASLLTPKQREKNIFKGNHEISPELGIGYSSFSGVIVNADVSYRYFFADKFSFGLKTQFSRSDWSDRLSVGPTMRWYFYETGKWAFSATQTLLFQYEHFKEYPYLEDSWAVKGATELGAHYFLTKEVALSYNIGLDYNIANKHDNKIEPSFYSRFGLSFQF